VEYNRGVGGWREPRGMMGNEWGYAPNGAIDEEMIQSMLGESLGVVGMLRKYFLPSSGIKKAVFC